VLFDPAVCVPDIWLDYPAVKPPTRPLLDPQSDDEDTPAFTILQFNANGIRSKAAELAYFLDQHNVHVAAIQETKLATTSEDPAFPGYSVLRRDRNASGGGIAFLIKDNVTYQTVDTPTDGTMESLGIKIFFANSNVTLINVYIPPTSSCPSGYRASLAGLLGLQDAIILGDLNAHDELWFSSLRDARGNDLSDEIDGSNFVVLNEDTPTRVPTNGPLSSPDVSIISDNLAHATEWSAMTTLASDHLPLLIKIGGSTPPVAAPRTTFVNIGKADWDRFLTETEAAFTAASAPSNVQNDEKVFRRIINVASKHAIPHGRHKWIKPSLPAAARTLMAERDALRLSDPSAPRIEEINGEIRKLTTEDKTRKWRSMVESFNRHTGLGVLWKLVGRLNKKEKAPDKCAISFGNKTLTNDREIASAFNRQFTAPRTHSSDKANRHLIRHAKRRPKTSADTFSVDEVANAIKACRNSKAFGPDEMTPIHLKHLGPAGIAYLTQLFNISIKNCRFPQIWKSSRVIPLLKPGKPSTEAKSYRPISLLCPAIKILEALLLPLLVEHLRPTTHQHGFRAQHSTVTALTKLTTKAADGFNQRKPPSRTLVAALDLTKAFDCVDLNVLLERISNTTLPDHLVRWLNGYLRGRQAATIFRSVTSSTRIIHCGVPQGSVISPALFNFYMADLPAPPAGVDVISYADDVTVAASGPKIDPLVSKLNEYLPRLKDFFSERKLMISAAKSTITLITPDPREVNIHPQVHINGEVLPLERTPKILGVTFDTMLTFGPHCHSAASRVKQRNSTLRALAGSTWGQDKETILMTYKATGRSILNYAAPVWYSLASKSSINRLQTVQNAALRTATGCLTMASIDHLHQECEILPVAEHSSLLSAQFLASCRDPDHPCHDITQAPRPPRPMKATLKTACSAAVERAATALGPDATPKAIMNHLHTTTVKQCIDQLEENVILGGRPPPISPSEKSLPRPTRCILSQLRSGYSSILNSYRHRIDESIPNSCPSCNAAPHTTPHLFNCRANPINADIMDLWCRPAHAAAALGLATN
jgi:hypothetical protein